MRNTVILVCLIIFKSSTLLSQAPTIIDFNPKKGPIGTEVTFIGAGFHPVPDSNIVYFGATKAKVIQASPTQLIVNVPNGATPKYPTITNSINGLTAYASQIFKVTFKGALTFLPYTKVSSEGSSPVAIQIADFDNNGKADVNVTNYGQRAPIQYSTTTILQNLTSSSNINLSKPTPLTIPNTTQSSTIGDLNGDGKIDIILQGRATYLKNNSKIDTVLFSSMTQNNINTNFGSNEYAIIDLDNDGKPEAVGASAFNNIMVYRNNSTVADINFSELLTFDTVVSSYNICVGDLDGDNKPDVALYTSSNISVLRNTSSAPGQISFAPVVSFPKTPDVFNYGARYAIAMEDLDGDGLKDLAVSNGGGYTVSVLKNTSTIGTINFAPKIDFTTGFSPYSVSIGDIDGDGKPELVSANQGSYSISILRNLCTPGTISFAPKTDVTVEQQPYAVAIGDLNMDGKTDIVAATFSTVSILQQTSTTKGSLYANGPFCGAGNGQLTFLGAAGNGPYTVVYNDGITNRTAINVFSGVPFNVASSPISSTTTYRLVSVTNPNNSVQTTDFDIDTATITVQSPPANINVTDNYTSGNYLISAGNISANNKISNATVEYKATQSIILLPGFSAVSNVFKASIGNACN
ncbi:MAG TPA: hypothetical protein DCM71_20185 [Runella sp.]|nr:hypothetical protein [Runella sp.]